VKTEFDATVDTTGWEKKSFFVRLILAQALREMVDYGMDYVSEKATENLAGLRHKAGTPSPTPGELPVTQITGHLHGAVRILRINSVLGKVFIDSGKAPYAAKVHEGTVDERGNYIMQPRRFMREAAMDSREVLYNVFYIAIKKRVQEVGRITYGI